MVQFVLAGCKDKPDGLGEEKMRPENTVSAFQLNLNLIDLLVLLHILIYSSR